MDTEIRDLIDFAKAVAESGLLASTSGNVSLRLGDDRMLLSRSGSKLADLAKKDVSVISLNDGTARQGPEPSLEAELHRRVYAVRDAARAVVHCQSRAATLFACHTDPPTNLDFIPEVPAYVRSHAYVPYATPGSDELADSVARAFEDPEVTVVQMRNHGQVIIGATWPKAVQRGIFFELACWMAAQGTPLETIPPDEAAILRTYARDV
jgi:L-fuculose-phosphate aldolase